MEIILIGRVVPKARPRFSKGHSYLPPRYRKWKENATIEICSKIPNGWEPLKKAKIDLIFEGNHNRNCDLDNLAGALLDVLVVAQVISDDRISVIKEMTIKFVDSKMPPQSLITITEIS